MIPHFEMMKMAVPRGAVSGAGALRSSMSSKGGPPPDLDLSDMRLEPKRETVRNCLSAPQSPGPVENALSTAQLEVLDEAGPPPGPPPLGYPAAALELPSRYGDVPTGPALPPMRLVRDESDSAPPTFGRSSSAMLSRISGRLSSRGAPNPLAERLSAIGGLEGMEAGGVSFGCSGQCGQECFNCGSGDPPEGFDRVRSSQGKEDAADRVQKQCDLLAARRCDRAAEISKNPFDPERQTNWTHIVAVISVAALWLYFLLRLLFFQFE